MSPEHWLEKIGMRVPPLPPINADERAPPLNGEEAAEPPRFSDVDVALRFVDRHAHSTAVRGRMGQVATVGR